MATLPNEKINGYLDRIGVPESVRTLLKEGPQGSRALEAVTSLQQYHMRAVPFENLDYHFTPEHCLQLEADLIYDTIVNKKRGGACPQIHPLFAQLLRSFGFEAYCSGGRLAAAASPAAPLGVDKKNPVYSPLVHVCTLVTIGDLKYLVDTNVGPAASPTPVPLVHDQPAVDVWERQRRMIFEPIPGWSIKSPLWRLQIREPEDEGWMDVCCFTESEWLQMDFNIMVKGIDTLGLGWFKSRLVCFRLEMENDKPCGYLLMVHDELRRGYKGKVSLVQKMYSEEERNTVLEEYFDIHTTPEEQKQIVGTAAELEDEGDYYDEEE